MFAVAPIQVDLMRKGFLVSVLTEAAKPRITERKMQLLAGVAHQAKLAITNAMSFESLEQTFLSTVEALANALEANDEYTSSHARAITDMALEVGTPARPRSEVAEAPGARSALPRHREDRHSVRGAPETRLADARRAEGHRAASRARRAHPRSDRAPVRRTRRSSAIVTSGSTGPAIPTGWRRRTFRSSRASSSSATRSTR